MIYKAVLFDLYDTLLYADEIGTRPDALALLAAAGIKAEDWDRAWTGTLPASLRGETTLLERVRIALKSAGSDDPARELTDQIAGLMYARSAPRVYPDVRPALADLRQRDYRLALVSNIAPYRMNWLAEFELERCFDALALSCELGALKPEPRIYLHAAKSISVLPRECVFVGDGMHGELDGCRGLGMTAVRLDRPVREDNGPRDACYDLRIENLQELLDWLPARAGTRRKGIGS